MTVRAARMPLTLTLENLSQTALPPPPDTAPFSSLPHQTALGSPSLLNHSGFPQIQSRHTTPCCPSFLSPYPQLFPTYLHTAHSLKTCTCQGTRGRSGRDPIRQVPSALGTHTTKGRALSVPYRWRPRGEGHRSYCRSEKWANRKKHWASTWWGAREVLGAALGALSQIPARP